VITPRSHRTQARALSVLLAATFLATACASDADRPVAMVPSSFTDLTDAIDNAIGTETVWVIAGSSRLVSQLADGADAELLVTADQVTMQRAIDADLVETPLGVIAGNRLVLAVAPGNPARIDDLADLADDDLLIGICAVEVPCGRLTQRAATTIGLTVAADTEEPNVRSLALKITRGELDGGLVYATDALRFSLDTVDDDALAPFATEYVAAAIHGTGSEIVDFLRSSAGRELLLAGGFSLP
jgi:molybdate transport system substrate-binding protein